MPIKSSFLDIARVVFECACGSWYPLSYLFFCKKCNHFRCDNCALEDVDYTFCPSCLDNTSFTDKASRITCSACFTCPYCKCQLVNRVNAESSAHYLQCRTCMWSTTEVGLESAGKKKNDWPVFPNKLEETLNNTLTQMKSLAEYEKPRERTQRRTLSNIGHVANDRFGVYQVIQNKKKKRMMERPISLPDIETVNVPELDRSIFTEEIDESKVLKLDQVLRLPYCDLEGIHPIPLKMSSRLHVRCPVHEGTIYRGDYTVTKPEFKHYFPCTDFCPEFKFCKDPEFSATEAFSVFITVINSSFKPIIFNAEIIESEDNDCLICTDQVDTLTLPTKDTTTISDQLRNIGAAMDPEALDTIVFRSNHRVGLNFKCTAKPGCEPSKAYLFLSATYRTHADEITSRVKLYIQK